MTDNTFAGPMSMVKIDGAKIKLLREQQGLTQLYLATAVEVTTDTISRWENRRYPSIKRDNGLKLAEALNVQLEDLLEEKPVEAPQADPFPQQPLQDLANDLTPLNTKESRQNKNRLLMIFSGVVVLVVVAFVWYFLYALSPGPFTAKRIVPPHCIVGQPFPVMIKVSRAHAPPTALIVKEIFPASGTVLGTLPAVTSAGIKNNQIKWLKKTEGESLFTYLISISSKATGSFNFNGSVGNSHSETPITGDQTIITGQYHWADTNKDNIISDDEILTVYDRYSELKDLDINIDLIEEIWLGSAYRWDESTNSFKIID